MRYLASQTNNLFLKRGRIGYFCAPPPRIQASIVAFKLWTLATRARNMSMMERQPSCRKPHRKSRYGCLNCKKRKIKCDETKPACAKCIRHELECSFLAPDHPTSSTGTHGATPNTTTIEDYATRSPTAAPNPFEIIQINSAHLELLYNFVTLTSFTLSCNEFIKILWQTNAVKVGLKCEYVMLSILALSALHLARLKPDPDQVRLSQAMTLHQAALSKGTPALSNITLENSEDLCLFAQLTCIFALGRPRAEGEFLFEGNSSMAEWLVIFRGARTVVESLDTVSLNAGPLGPMFAAGARRAQLQLSAPAQVDHLWMLQRVINEMTCVLDERIIYNKTLDQLREPFNLAYNQGVYSIESSDVLRWLYIVSEEYLGLLCQRKPEALAIFAYFCVLLKKLDALWWVQGLGNRFFSEIYNVLDESSRLWINWPMREIGWVP